MGLLSTTDIADIRAAIKQVTDTFMQLPVIYHQSGVPLDTFQEDRGRTYTDYPLVALMLPPKSALDRSELGSMDNSELTLYFNYDDMAAHVPTLITASGNSIFAQASDLFTVQAEKYRIIDIQLEGQLVKRPMLVTVTLIKKEKYQNVA